MGTYLNPGNSGFEKIRNSIYVDKTGLIRLINQTIGTIQKLTCISRTRCLTVLSIHSTMLPLSIIPT